MNKTWFLPRKPEEITPYPWLHPGVVAYLESLLCPEWRVLEYGAGGSTLWFAERVAKVVSIEHNLEWRTKVRELAPGNVCLMDHYSNGGPPPFEPHGYDLFFIDGDIDGNTKTRGTCLETASMFVKPGGWVVLDNANRPEYRAERIKLAKQARLVKHFDNNCGVSMYFVTEFWQCE